MPRQSDIKEVKQDIKEALEMLHSIDKEVVALSITSKNIIEKVERQNGRVLRLERGTVGFLLAVVGYLIYAVIALIQGGS